MAKQAMQIDWDATADGYACFRGPKELGIKLAVLGTKHNQGLVKNGVIVMEPMPRQTWSLHFTSPYVNVEELKAILDGMPEEA